MRIQSPNQNIPQRNLPTPQKPEPQPTPPPEPEDKGLDAGAPNPRSDASLTGTRSRCWGKIAKGALVGAGVGAVGAGAGHATSALGMHMGPVAAGATALGIAGSTHGVVSGAKEMLNTPMGAVMLFVGLIFPPALLLVAAEPAAKGIAEGLGGAAAGAALGWMGSQGPVGLALAVATGAAAGATAEWIKQSSDQ
ncbi:MAG: hypothetical protein J0I12_25775 [Candidatus Eremiobacteraeota bacterium]|nr:hypothetical protein [Candidatus Eremiobacteraeota bacterium]